MPDLNDVLQLKKDVEQLQRDTDRAIGQLEAAQARLREEFDCSSLEEAEKKLKELEAEEQRASKAFAKALNSFHKRWGDRLDGTEGTEADGT